MTRRPFAQAPLKELLYQLADDNFLLAYRGSEWLGLAPHIEEDVAFSSISQDLMGHAFMFYRLLEELGEGEVDALAHNRGPDAYRNAVILELENGLGTYMEQPHYDWAFTVVRYFFYACYKKVQLEALKQSSYEPLAIAAKKMVTEHPYHLLHWQTWFVQLMSSTSEARRRMEDAIQKVWRDFGGVWSYGALSDEIITDGLIVPAKELKKGWEDLTHPIFNKVGYTLKGEAGLEHGDGRLGDHTKALQEAITIFSEVYQSDPLATGW